MANKTYWEGLGQYQDYHADLAKLIPALGEITDKKAKSLEKLRKAMNCYHDFLAMCKTWLEFT